MVATIQRVIVWGKRANIVARDHDDRGVEKLCYLFLDTPKQQLIASLCQESAWPWLHPKPQIALTVKPKTRYGYEIEAAELLHAEAP